MPDNNIVVEQLDKPGDINHDKWYVARGDGANAQYLRRDISWHKENVTSENFFWLTKDAANVAATQARLKDSLC